MYSNSKSKGKAKLEQPKAKASGGGGQSKANAAMGEMMNRKVAHTTQMREKVPRKAKRA